MDAGYGQARAAIAERFAAESVDSRLCAQGRTRVFDHGRRTPRSLVLFHGFTNAPEQMDALGRLFYERGYNVIIPRLPGHGVADRMTTALTEFTAERIAEAGAEAFDWAQGLGERVDVMGISLGGVIAAWLAQHRNVRVALPLSPFFALPGVPGFLSDGIGAIMRRLPFYLWWDPRVKEDCLPAHAYPRYPAKALGACLEFGSRVRAAAKSQPPMADTTIVVTNSKEPACNNAVTRALVGSWQARSGAVESREFTDVGLRHDIIELETYPEARATVYPRILEMIDEPALSAAR